MCDKCCLLRDEKFHSVYGFSLLLVTPIVYLMFLSAYNSVQDIFACDHLSWDEKELLFYKLLHALYPTLTHTFTLFDDHRESVSRLIPLGSFILTRCTRYYLSNNSQ